MWFQLWASLPTYFKCEWKLFYNTQKKPCIKCMGICD
jgi:hypothetical protein